MLNLPTLCFIIRYIKKQISPAVDNNTSPVLHAINQIPGRMKIRLDPFAPIVETD